MAPRKGFTLIELMVVLVILAIGAGLTLSMLSRSRSRQETSRALIDVAAVIRHARSVARIAGARVGTSQITFDGACLGSDPTLNVRIDPGAGTVTYPAQAQRTATGINILCDTWRIPFTEAVPITMVAPTSVTDVSFTSVGRLVGGPIAVQFREPQTGLTRGILVMSSGLICESSFDVSVAQCNEEPQ